MFILILLTTILLTIIYRLNLIKNVYLKLTIKYLIFSIFLGFIIEITIFNYRFYDTLIFSLKNDYIPVKDYIISPGITCNNDLCQITDIEKSYIEIKNINKKINNLYLDFGEYKEAINIKVYLTDEANSRYYNAGTRDIVSPIEKSHYLKIHTSGKTSKIKLVITNEEAKFNIKEIGLNKIEPLKINYIRLILAISFIFALFTINPKSKLYELKYNAKGLKIITVLLIISLSLVFYKLTTFNTYINNTTEMTSNHAQYKNLAEALVNKKLSLNLKVSDKLLKLKNPYDTKLRNKTLKRGVDYYWDYAYYKGNYYSYFGIVPCLLLYVPYYLVTNTHIANNVAIAISSFIFLISSFYLIYEVINKYFKKTSYIWYIILSLFYVFASGLLPALGYPAFYNLPIMLGVAFASLGLGFWLKSTTYPKLNKIYLGLGSLCMALVAGCRPQLLLSSFFALIIFKDYIFKKRELISKKSIKETIAFILPFVIIGLLLMLYNYLRFNSPFDFGANYNLTTNDMTKRGLVFDRVFLGLYSFLFEPTRINPVFPFIVSYNINPTYIGTTIHETMYGGFFFTNIICFLGLFFFKFKNLIKNKELSSICLWSIITALIIVLADTQMAGILSRYIFDFGWAILLSTIIVILAIVNNKPNLEIKKLILFGLVLSIVINTFLYFQGSYLFLENNYFYQKLYYMFMFWL